ncbi:MAG: hypothetical protein A2Y84_01020 [Candidatus Colwellbacteria bacterium RBG_13_48_8]|uniref:Uncharacterized protein n=1 Tax=Candidatus Colwellbacteria bacterium RBG_13_48_8 TaxID=1797685 RepID=A0A1G1YVB9_9BACT|nr:MAG: hypothetical protein A2Y84_01020 [Candidatus Colwellbacteria bacterium RBG_13_48_8]
MLSGDWEFVVNGPWAFRVAPDGLEAVGVYAGVVKLRLCPRAGNCYAKWGERVTAKGHRWYIPEPYFWPYLAYINDLMLEKQSLRAAALEVGNRPERRRIIDSGPEGKFTFLVHPFGDDCWVWCEAEGRTAALIHFVRGQMGRVDVDPDRSRGALRPDLSDYVHVRAGRLMHGQATLVAP